MRSSFASLALLALSSVAFAQTPSDILFYRFDANYGDKVINYAVNSPAPAQGTIQSTLPGAPASAWTSGRFGSALTACTSSTVYNRVDTGWIPGTFTGSFSFALWLRRTTTSLPSLYYLFGSPTSGSFRFYGGGGAFLLATGFPSTYYRTTALVSNLALNKWVHVAFVVDPTSNTCTFYIDGVAETPLTLSGVPGWTSNVPFLVGQQLPTSMGSVFDIDEFLFTRRVLTPTEVQALANGPKAGDGAYGGGCGNIRLTSSNGPPTIGNLRYGIDVTAKGTFPFALGYGSNRASFGGVPLPFDVGQIFPGIGTCPLESSLDVLWVASVVNNGQGRFALPILANPAFAGVTLYAQGIGLPSGVPLDLSEAFAIGLGN